MQLFNIRLSTIFAANAMIWTYNHNISAQLVVGSLGIGQLNPYWEWTGDNYSTIKQFC